MIYTFRFCSTTYANISENNMNIAEGRPAKQSSTTGKAVGLYAVDGNVDGLGVYGECSVTRESSNPWWKVDLGKTYRVDNVVVIIGTKHTGGWLIMRHSTAIVCTFMVF